MQSDSTGHAPDAGAGNQAGIARERTPTITINSQEQDYLRKLILRAYWDGSDQPSIETPVGDFFGVGHGRVSNYWSLPLNMVTGGRPESQSRAAMNCFFPMPFARGARITLEAGNPLISLGLSIGGLALVLTLIPLAATLRRSDGARLMRSSWSLLLYFGCMPPSPVVSVLFA